jgi:hypothetical protein
MGSGLNSRGAEQVHVADRNAIEGKHWRGALSTNSMPNEFSASTACGERLVASVAEAKLTKQASDDLGYPVVLKTVAHDLPHNLNSGWWKSASRMIPRWKLPGPRCNNG